jgi:hypothetical protein
VPNLGQEQGIGGGNANSRAFRAQFAIEAEDEPLKPMRQIRGSLRAQYVPQILFCDRTISRGTESVKIAAGERRIGGGQSDNNDYLYFAEAVAHGSFAAASHAQYRSPNSAGASRDWRTGSAFAIANARNRSAG